MSMIKNWNDNHSKAFHSEVMTFDHGINDTGLFTDEALAALLDKHPSHLTDVCTRGKNNDPKYPGMLRTGDFRDCSGKDLIAAAKEGWIWINLRKVMNIHPEYKAVLDQMYGELSENTGSKIYNPYGGILITAPVARTPYHADKSEVVLWHIRGKKEVYVYPLEEQFIADKDYEELLTNPIQEDLPYDKSFDDKAMIIDLKEGEAVTWPLNSPHRVVNSSFCVSVTTEYSTRESGMKNAAMIANATFRQKFGSSKTYSEQGKTARALRSVFGRVIKKAGLAADAKPVDLVSFKVDPGVPGYIVEIEPFERNF